MLPALIILSLDCFRPMDKSPHLKGRTWSWDLIQGGNKLHCSHLIVRGHAKSEKLSLQRCKHLVGKAKPMCVEKTANPLGC